MNLDEDTTILLSHFGEAVDGCSGEEQQDESCLSDVRLPDHYEPRGSAALRQASAAPPGGGDASLTVVVACAAAAAGGGLLVGYDLGVVSGALDSVRRQLALSCRQSEAVVSVTLAGALVSSLVGGWLVDRMGRKCAIIVNAILFLLGSVVLATAATFNTVVLGRFVVGFAVSLSAISQCVYISEIAPDSRRGLLVSLNEFAITIGFLLSYLAGFLLIERSDGWRYMFGLAAVPAVLQAIVMLFLPQTPHFLLMQRKERQAERVLQRLTGRVDVKQQLALVRLSVGAVPAGHGSLHHTGSCSSCCCCCAVDGSNVGPAAGCGALTGGGGCGGAAGGLAVGAALVLLQQASGQPTLLSYAPTVLHRLGYCAAQTATASTVALGVVKVLFTGVALLLIDRVGRRRLLLTGVLLMSVCLLALAVMTSSAPHPGRAAPSLCAQPNNSQPPTPEPQSTPEPQTSVTLQSVASLSTAAASAARHHDDPLVDSLFVNRSYGATSTSVHDTTDQSVLRSGPVGSGSSSSSSSSGSGSSSSSNSSGSTIGSDGASVADGSGDNAIAAHGNISGDDSDTGHAAPCAAAAAAASVDNTSLLQLVPPGDNCDRSTVTESPRHRSARAKTPATTAAARETQRWPHSDVTPAPSSSTGVTQRQAGGSEEEWCHAAAIGRWRPLLSLAALMGVVAGYSVGFGPVTWLLLSELLPPPVKGRALALVSALNWLANAVLAGSFLQTVDWLSLSGVFSVYCAACLTACIFVYLTVPETRNRSLHEIAAEIQSRRCVVWSGLRRRWCENSAHTAAHYSHLTSSLHQ